MTFVLEVETDEDRPAYHQIADALRKSIEEGRLAAGEKMPSVRDLAESIGVSAATVGRSYDALTTQGYVKTVPGSGAFVRGNPLKFVADWQSPGLESPFEEGSLRLAEYGERIMGETFLRQSPGLNSGAPLIEDLAIRRWQDTLAKCIRFDDPSLLAYESDPMGYTPLREALAAYLLRTRSVKCSPDQIVVFPRIEAGTDQICQVIIKPGDSVVVEDPCYPARLRGFRVRGAQVIALPVDANGLIVDRLHDVPDNVRLVHVTPSHHDPSGVPLSMGRRKALMEWAAKSNSFILENDYDSEYCYGVPYLPAMQGMDTNDLVIYRYTFWRALYPLVRMSMLVLPKRLVPIFRRIQTFLGEAPILEQKVLAEFIKEGQLERHIKRTRSTYEGRRVALITALTQHFRRLPITTAGMHLLVTFPERYSTQAILRAGQESGLSIQDTTMYYHSIPPRQNEFMVGFAYYPSPEAVHQAVSAFASALETSI